VLHPRIIDDIIAPVKSLSFRQWVACVTMVAVLFSAAAPLGLCRCEGCHCENHISRLLPDFAFPNLAVADGDCCCISPEPIPDEDCCGLPSIPCPCLCCDIGKNDTVAPAILPVKQPKIGLSWDIVSALPVSFTPPVSGVSSLSGNHRVLPSPHVPLHILLCVFLN